MARVESSEILGPIIDVISNASTGKGIEHGYLTAYQIFKHLPPATRNRLIRAYGLGGKGSGRSFSAATRIAKIAKNSSQIETAYLDTTGLRFDVGNTVRVKAGYKLCAIYRLSRHGQ